MGRGKPLPYFLIGGFLMTTTYFSHFARYMQDQGDWDELPSGSYTREGGGTVTIVGTPKRAGVTDSDPSFSSDVVFNLTGDIADWEANKGLAYNKESSAPYHHTLVVALDRDFLLISEAEDGGSPVSGVTGVGGSSPFTGEEGHYRLFGDNLDTVTPVKSGYAFAPGDLDVDTSGGTGIHTTWEVTEQRTVILDSPSNGLTGVRMDPTLDWHVDGSGSEDGDYFFIYLKKDDPNFTEYDLLQGWRVSTQIKVLYGLSYDTTYYWQVQAAREGGGLSDSDVWSFNTTPLRSPTHSTRPKGEDFVPTGENNQLTVHRLIAAAMNKIYYEDV
jgi:hypothetical protein